MAYSTRSDDSDTRRLFTSAALAALLWIVLGVFFALMPAIRRTDSIRQYRDVTIVLMPPEKVAKPVFDIPKEEQKVEKVPEPKVEIEKPAPAKPVQTKPVQTKPAPTKTPAPKPAVKGSSNAKPAPQPASVGLGIPNFSAPVQSSPSASADAEYLDFASQNTSRQQEVKRSNDGGSPIAELEGSAGVIRTETGGASSTAQPVRTATGSTMSETTAALDKIAGTARSGSVAESSPEGGSSTGTSANARNSSAITGLSFEGTPRKLLQPVVPSITLPENLVRLVDSDRSVTVEFTVLGDGTVPVGLVFFTPSAALPPEIRDYLKREFSRWRFEKHGKDGQARFVYSIKMK